MSVARLQQGAVAGYVLAVVLAATWEHGPRLIWTVLIAALPLFFVIGGFHLWRRICPLSWFSQLPIRAGRGGQRKVSGRLAEHPIVLPAGLMFVGLTLRLVAINGSGLALAAFLVAVAGAAIAVGATYRGKTWCNFVCPVGFVERVYTEPSRLIDSGNSQCKPCSACTARCPDIDTEQGYWKSGASPSRRAAWFAWPGLVVGFYLHYALQAGDWSWYFDGAWTYEVEQPGRWLDAGYAIGGLPRILAAPLTLALCGLLSWGAFDLGESLALQRATDDAARRRVQHRALALAGFVAFNAFYAFAGQPTLRVAPGWLQWAVAFAVVGSSTLMLVRRWNRSEAAFVQDRFAKKLARRWKWDEADRSRPAQELVVIHGERTRARTERLEAYENTLRELAEEGTVTRDGLALLATVRGQLGVSEAEHAGIVKKLEAGRQDLFDADRSGDLQRGQYRTALGQLVEAAADAGGVLDERSTDRLRRAHGVSAELHAEVLAELRSPDAALAQRVDADAQVLAELAALAADADDSPMGRLRLRACDHAGRPVLDALLAILRATGDPRADGLDGDVMARGALAEASDVDGAQHPDPWVAATCGGAEVPHLASVLVLVDLPLLEGLSPAGLARVAERSQTRSLAAGEVLCRQGDPGDEVFLVLDGVLRADVDGRDVGRSGRGEALGELAVLSPAPRAATLTAVEPCTLLTLSAGVFSDLLRDQPTLAEGVLSQLARRLQQER